LRCPSPVKLGVSWGGHESLAFPAAAGLAQQGAANPLAFFGVPEATIRLHIGLEDPDDLWSDLAQALVRAAA
jgi:cystathionine beta-lyase/cystathionine gamma-synthase